MKRLLLSGLLICVGVMVASAQTPLLVSHLDAIFSWDVPAFTPDTAPDSHVVTCGTNVVTVAMPATSVAVRDVVPGPGTYTCTLYAQNSVGRQSDPNVPFPVFQSGYIAGTPFQLAVLPDSVTQPPPGNPMPVAFGTESHTTYTTRTNTTITAPSGITDGDELYAFVVTVASGTAPTPTPPAGFSALSGSPTSVTFSGFSAKLSAWKKSASGESGNYTFTHSSSSSQGLMIRVTGADPGTPVVSTNTGTGSTTTFTGITTSADNSLVIGVMHDWGDTANNLTAPSGTTPTFTERVDVAPLIYSMTGILTTAGATGSKTMTNNSSSSTPWASYLIGIAPAGGGSASVVPILMAQYQRRRL